MRNSVLSLEASSSFSTLWDSSDVAKYEQYLHTGPNSEREDEKVVLLKKEMPIFKQKRERLQAL
jgi:hypothetical protein